MYSMAKGTNTDNVTSLYRANVMNKFEISSNPVVLTKTGKRVLLCPYLLSVEQLPVEQGSHAFLVLLR